VPKSIVEGAYVPIRANQVQHLPAPGTSSVIIEHIIGITSFDLQSNASIRNGLINNGDGTLSAVWNHSADTIIGGWPDRGTGYNYFDGANWGPIPTTRLESTRTGWPSVAGTSTGKEAIVSHMSAANPGPGVMYLERPVKGTGPWTENSLLFQNGANDLWPRLVSGDVNGLSLHTVANGSGASNIPLYGQTGPILYSRTNDNGTTWSPLRGVIPQIDLNSYLGFDGDNYHLTTHGDNIAIGVSNLATDVAVIKSTDNGSTWTRTIILEFPIPMFNDHSMISDVNGDGVADIITTGAGDIHVLFDNNGLLHAWYSITNVLCDDTIAGLSYFPTDGLYYWNENMGPDSSVLIAYAPDLNGDGVITLPSTSICSFPFATYGAGITQMPTAGVDANNNLYCAYFTVNELSDTLTYSQAHMHTYIIKSLNGGLTWTTPENALNIVDVTQPVNAPYYEAVSANMAKQVDSNIHIIYQRDFVPGTSVGFTCFQNFTSEIVYNRIAPADVPAPSGIEELPPGSDAFVVSDVFPNPSRGIAGIYVRTKNFSNLTLKVFDITGRDIYTDLKSKIHAGTHKFTINTSGFSSGSYCFSVSDGNYSVNKMFLVN